MEEARTAALVGCGAVAELSYAKALKRLPALRTRFVCDLNTESARRVAAMLDAEVVDFAEALERAQVIIVATPPASHFGLVGQAIEAGRTVLCEKPFVATAQQANDLVRCAADRHVDLFVGHFRRCYPAVRAARDLVATRALGEVLAIDVVEGGRFAWPSRSRYVEEDRAGGVLFDTGSHAIDMALFMAGLDTAPLVVDVQHVRRDRQEPAHEIAAEFTINCDGRAVRAKAHLSRFRVLGNRIRLLCERATLDVSTAPRDRFRIWGLPSTALVYAGTRSPDFQSTFLEQLRRIFGPMEGGEDFKADRFLGLTAILEGIATAVGGGR